MQNPALPIEQSSTLESLEAYLDFIEQGPEAALAKLEGKEDPDSIRRRLAILVNAGRLPEAIALIKDRPPHERWADIAVQVFTSNGSLTEARAALDWAWATTDRALKARCLVGFADGVIQLIFADRTNGKAVIVPGSLSTREENLLQETVNRLEPFYAALAVAGKVSTELESEALQRLLTALYLLQERARAEQVAMLLSTKEPLPLKVGEATIQGLIAPSVDLVDRLRKEHPESFQALLLACLIESRGLHNAPAAFHSALQMVNRARTAEDKEALCELLYELALAVGGDAVSLAEQAFSQLADDKSPTLTTIRAHIALQNGQLEQSLALLERVRDEENPLWSRLYAAVLEQRGQPQRALETLQKICLENPDPVVFAQISDLALKTGDSKAREEALRQLVALRPEDHHARHNLAGLYIENSRYSEAAEQFQWLCSHQPAELTYVINLAFSLAYSGADAEALKVLNTACDKEPAALQAFLARARILLKLGRASDAFLSLEKARERFWDEPQFLTAYMDAGYASENELKANEALQQLQRLTNQGRGGDMLRVASLDEVGDMLRTAKGRTDTLRQYELQGKAPWTLTSEVSNEVPYWAWTLRTQPLRALFEEPIHRAAYTIYATNGFRVLYSEDGSASVTEVECAARGSVVAADISALITLHNLGILKRTAEYFEKIYIPVTYLTKAIDETRRLFPHQASQKTSAQKIRDAVERSLIAVLDDSAADARQMPNVNEYSDDTAGNTPYRIVDVLSVLHFEGAITDEQRADAGQVCHAPATANPARPPLSPSQPIMIDDLTLNTIVGAQLLDVLCRYFRVHISASDYEGVTSKLRAFHALDNVRANHTALWDMIQSDSRFIPRPIPKKEDNGTGVLGKLDISLAAPIMATEERLPLLADDRVCQGLLLNARNQDLCASFGSDRMLIALNQAGTITDDELADYFLRLMEWRYRFLILPRSVLMTYAKRFLSNPPGAQLRAVARYLHDCMRDPGLFAGIEPTTPPTSIAFRLYQGWARVVAEFLIDVSVDPAIPEAGATEIIKWAVGEMLPSPPAVLSHEAQAVLGRLLPKIVLSAALIHSTNADDAERVNSAMIQMGTLLGLDTNEYLGTITEVLDAGNL